jgi:hypothetical protein
MSTAQAITETMGSPMKDLATVLCEAITMPPPVPPPPTPVLPPPTPKDIAISIVEDDLHTTQDDKDDAFEIFTNKPQVAGTYAAIKDASAHARYLHKRLVEFRAEQMYGIRED